MAMAIATDFHMHKSVNGCNVNGPMAVAVKIWLLASYSPELIILEERLDLFGRGLSSPNVMRRRKGDLGLRPWNCFIINLVTEIMSTISFLDSPQR